MTGWIFFECLSAIIMPAAFSPAPPKAASTPTLSKPANDRFVDAQRSYSRSLPSDATSFHGLKPLLTP